MAYKKLILGISLFLCLMFSLVYTQNTQSQHMNDRVGDIQDDEDDDQMNDKWRQYQIGLEKQVKDEEISIQSKAQETEQIQEYREIIKRSIMKKAVESDLEQQSLDHITSNNFQSFLEMKRGILGFESPVLFFGQPVDINVQSLPIAGNSEKKPWSASYFPERNGVISARYAPNKSNTIGLVNNLGNYVNYYTLVQSIYKYNQPSEHRSLYSSNTFENYVNNNYSPSEKYYLLVGDNSYILTNFLKRKSISLAKNGDVPSWFGICHGVAPATIYFNKPVRPVTLVAADGKTRIRFLPDDIKALAAQFWATTDYKTRFMGGRCNFTRAQSDWYNDPKCRSLNPASVIITLGNMIGKLRKNFVLDPNADPEIWNETVYSYELRYYNVFNNRFYKSAVDPKVPVSQLRNSSNLFLRKVAANIHGKTTHIVGVVMRFSYAQNNDLRWDVVSNPDSYRTQGVDAIVELDAFNNLVGGEWKTNSYPNFMWRFDDKFKIGGVSDRYVTSFNGSTSQLRSITNYARNASSKGQVLKAIVQYLINASS